MPTQPGPCLFSNRLGQAARQLAVDRYSWPALVDGLGIDKGAVSRMVQAMIDLGDNGQPIDLVLLTHAHFDHFHKPTLRRLPHPKIGVMPWGMADLALGGIQSRRLLARLRPSVVVGFGGYASVSPMIAAATLGVPTVLHEQNALLGRANRLLAPRVTAIATSASSAAPSI